MRAFTSARYTVSLGNHWYPMEKYQLVPKRLVTEGILREEELIEPEAASVTDVLRSHARVRTRADQRDHRTQGVTAAWSAMV